jgi:hypothetical protein
MARAADFSLQAQNVAARYEIPILETEAMAIRSASTAKSSVRGGDVVRKGVEMRRFLSLLGVAVVVGLAIPAVAAPPTVTSAVLLVSGLEGGSGSTVGPGGALYVTEGLAGRVSRVDPQTGEVTTFASGLPESIVGFGGAMDVAFIGNTAYVLVTLVGTDVGGSDVVGIYSSRRPR